MFYSGIINVDPAQITTIEREDPKGIFKRLLNLLTGGGLSTKKEVETFTAVSILQQFNSAFRSMGITNIVRLTQDETDFYFDTEGKEDDLRETMDRFEMEIDEGQSRFFKRLHLMLAHKDAHFNYTLDINIMRTHEVGEYPISIKVNGLLADYSLKEGSGGEILKQRMGKIFSSQEKYTEFCQEKKVHFEYFLHHLSQSIQKFIRIDDIDMVSKPCLVAPRKKINSPAHFKPKVKPGSTTLHYHRSSDDFFYSFLWYELLQENHISIQSLDIVDELGEKMLSIGEEALDTALYSLETLEDWASKEADSNTVEPDRFGNEPEKTTWSSMGEDTSDTSGFDDSSSFD